MNLNDIKNDLKAVALESHRIGMTNYFKESIICYGVKAKQIDEVSRHHYKSIKNESKETVFQLCDQLWQAGTMEECLIACDWSFNQRKKFEPTDFERFEFWIKNHITNWATCDSFCTKNIGAFLELFPNFSEKVKSWAYSERRWDRRASAVSFIKLAKVDAFLQDMFDIADILLMDKDDLVQKGYGWMLKSASQNHLELVFDYVQSNKSKMPRTALRYAIEKMPLDLKRMAMEK